MSVDTQIVEHRYDRVLLVVTFVLIGLGLVMVYSASIVSAENQWGDGAHFVKRQLAYLIPGLMAMVFGMTVHHQIWSRIARPMLAIAVLLLVVALVPGLSTSAKGASRWLDLKVFRLQPSEIVKLSLIIFLAKGLSERQHELGRWRVAWLPNLAITAVIAGLLMMQPDFGSTVICGGMVILMVWAAGGRHLHTFVLIGGGIGLGAMAVLAEPYRLKRLMAFTSPEADPQGVAYQINQALISFGSGDWMGLGLGGSRQKLLYLPDAHTDFIFSIIGEELGLLGASCVVLLFILFIWRGLRIARRASNSFGALLAFGLTAAIGIQAVTNMAVVMAMLPTKGLTLPFVSYGGSSLVMLCGAVGILLNISRRTPPPAWMHREKPETTRRRRQTAATEQVASLS